MNTSSETEIVPVEIEDDICSDSEEFITNEKADEFPKTDEEQIENIEPEIVADNGELVIPENSDAVFANAAFGLLINLSRIISDDYDKEHRKLKSQIDSKLRRAINRKKQELGIKHEHGQIQKY